MSEFKHYSVMLRETIDMLDIKEDGIYVDCTMGGAGHSSEIAKRLKGGRLICIDQDTDAIEAGKKRLAPYSDKVTFVNDNFKNIKQILSDLNIEKVDGITADLGVSSYQLDTAERGFSYHFDAPLDMRMNRQNKFSAYNLVNEYSEKELTRVINDWGEEKFASRIAKGIVNSRQEKKIETTFELVDIIKNCIPKSSQFDGKHPARRTFQALRIEVNNEISILKDAVEDMVDCLKKSGRIAVITFHSLEDRAVKEVFSSKINGCTCPRNFPVCVCGFKAELELINKKPITAEENELEENNRSRSAKLRGAKKIKE
ncbi:MAG: 16S rRNA (cytosine(1402)-N(4))-methyltransferase RsmH [Ruminococcaceae bacterium]|nr:16S rRNA (cytosine(1402)-N(4))-methyltransferase RsmH [Oscillospiraceae bacterium]